MKIIPIAFTSQELSELQSVLDLAASRLPRPWMLGEPDEQGDFHIISIDQPEELSKHLRISSHLDPQRIIAYMPEETAAETRWVLRKRPHSPPRMSEIWNLLANIEQYLQGTDTETLEKAEQNRQIVADERADRDNSSMEIPVASPDAPTLDAAENEPPSPPPMAGKEGDSEDCGGPRRNFEDDLANWDGVSTIALLPSSSLAFEVEDASPVRTPQAMAPEAPARHTEALSAQETTPEEPPEPEHSILAEEYPGSGESGQKPEPLETGEEQSDVLNGLRLSQVERRDWLKTALTPASPSVPASLPELLQQALKDQTARLFFINDRHAIMVCPGEETCHFPTRLESTVLLFRTYPDRIRTKALPPKQAQAHLQKYGPASAPLSELLWLAAIIDSRAALLPDLSPEPPVRLASAASLVTLPHFELFSSLAEAWLSGFLNLQQASEKSGEPIGKTAAFYNAGTLLRLFEANPRIEIEKAELHDTGPAAGKSASPTLLQKISGVFKGKRPE
jgi:hypothetical protein